MTWDEWILLVAGLVLVIGWVVWVKASRLDRLHRKVAGSQAVLDRQLVRRATVAVELASAGLMDPVSSVLVGEAAFEALELSGHATDALAPPMPDLPELIREPVAAASGTGAPFAWQPGPISGALSVANRGLVESALSSTLRTALEDRSEVAILREQPGGADLVDALAAAWYRVQLARRFHNEAVAQTQRVRRQRVVRHLWLAGRAPFPRALEFDDAWPEALGRPGASGQVPAV
jgi:hypothetical protein